MINLIHAITLIALPGLLTMPGPEPSRGLRGGQLSPQATAAAPLLRWAEPETWVYRDYEGPYWRVGLELNDVRRYSMKHGLTGPMFVRFLSNPVVSQASMVKAQIGILVPDDHVAEPPFQIIHHQRHQVISTMIESRTPNRRRHYTKLFGAATKWGFEPTGPVMEIYHTNSASSQSITQKTEIRMEVGHLRDFKRKETSNTRPAERYQVEQPRSWKIPKPKPKPKSYSTSTTPPTLPGGNRSSSNKPSDLAGDDTPSPHKEYVFKPQPIHYLREAKPTEIPHQPRRTKHQPQDQQDQPVPKRQVAAPEVASRDSARQEVPILEKTGRGILWPKGSITPKPPAVEPIQVKQSTAKPTPPETLERFAVTPPVHKPVSVRDHNPVRLRVPNPEPKTTFAEVAVIALKSKTPDSIEELLYTGQYEAVAELIFPKDLVVPSAHQVWVGQVMFRIKAVAQGLHRMYPGKAPEILALSDTLGKHYRRASHHYSKNPLNQSLIRMKSSRKDDLIGGQKRAILDDLDRLMGRLAIRAIDAESTSASLLAILGRIQHLTPLLAGPHTAE